MAKAAVDKSYLTRPDCKDLDHIPGTDGLPYFGSSLSTIWGLEEVLEKHYQKWGEVSRLKMLHQRGVLVLGVDNYQRIFLDREQNFSTEMGFAESIGQFYKGGILMKDFADHKFLRRMMQTAFKNAAMRNYVGMMMPVMDRHIQKWDQIDNFQFFPHIKETLLEVGAEVFIGAKAGEDTKKMNQAFLDINDGLLGQLRKEIPGTKYNKGKKGERYLREYFSGEIDKRREGDGADMLSFMCREKTEDGEFFDKELIIPQASFLLFAAHDTTTSVLNHMIYYTAKHPEWQDAMRAEVEALGKDELDYDDLDKLEIMERVFNECLRLRPSVSFLTRRTIRECEIGGHQIPADTMIFMSPIHNHRDPKFWTNPNAFDPDRFLPERAEQKNHSFAWHPFGGGAHKCIGMHFAMMLSKAFMFQLLKTYKYSLPADFKTRFEWVPLPKPTKLPVKWERL
ncbi:Putative cytochrome P450 136 [BD1-7 clade bacterium]|uniref:Cytochrome P450 136 n=1 Tax=BD1-7 clade bacterium TaxID=2029982 RepID=A0A5S9QXJ3_9GAMM|nr:Putative cytochrome P450 136 [BD1-7 clade bacterium]